MTPVKRRTGQDDVTRPPVYRDPGRRTGAPSSVTPSPVRVHREFDLVDHAGSMRILLTVLLSLVSYVCSNVMFVEAARYTAP
jgi:hypothetical protein